jgi:nitrate reductase assembly molybdenum cofactor insertion protein NarJ|tara:strand:+ start:160 stop:921 length:762 start_codon:yes stop_codon:yes gene_type:complete
MQSRDHYHLLARLFVYPEFDYPDRVRAAIAGLREEYPEAAMELENFVDLLPAWDVEDQTIPLNEIQEVYTRSFEVQAITPLDVGYVCFGDDYKRAELLVNLNREHREAGVDWGTELSDHLPNILRLVSKSSNQAILEELISQVLYPAVSQMLHEFRPERMDQRNKLYKKYHKTLIATSEHRATMFRHTLAAVQVVLKADWETTAVESIPQSRDFLRSIHREFEIEDKGAGRRPADALKVRLPQKSACGAPRRT